MWIESIDIKGFGCLADCRCGFPSDGAALIIADNEKGKSTLAAAILAALCGFPKERRAEGRIISQDAFKPWNGDAYAVEMDISAGGKRLRIERDFARGTYVVRDTETGKDVSAQYESDLCEHFLRLPLDDFRRIAVVAGKDAPSLGSTTGIQARLSGLVEGSADDASAEVAIAALDSARYSLDAGGPLKIETAVKRLTDEIENKRRATNALENALDAAGADARDLEEAEGRQAGLKAALDDLDSEYDSARNAEEQANAEKVGRLNDQIAIERMETALSAIKQRRATGRLLGIAVAVGGLAVSVMSFMLWVLGSLRVTPSVAGALVGIAAAAVGAVQAARSRWLDADEKTRLEREIDQIQARASQASGEVQPRASRSSSQIDAERQKLRGDLDTVNARIRELEKRVGRAVDDYRAQYPDLRDEAHRLEREHAKVERFGKAVGIAKEVLGEVAEESGKRWAAALNRSACLILPHLNPDYDDLRFDDTLAFTIRHIPDNRTLEKPDIDACLSTGAKDQVYLAVRLAICDELSRGSEAIPVLLDDPLMSADDSRFASGFRCLVEDFAKRHQVIILSCSRDRHERLTREPWFADNVRLLELEGPR